MPVPPLIARLKDYGLWGGGLCAVAMGGWNANAAPAGSPATTPRADVSSPKAARIDATTEQSSAPENGPSSPDPALSRSTLKTSAVEALDSLPPSKETSPELFYSAQASSAPKPAPSRFAPNRAANPLNPDSLWSNPSSGIYGPPPARPFEPITAPLFQAYAMNGDDSGRRPLRIGPLKIQASMNTGVTYTDTGSESALGDSSSAHRGKINQESVDGFQTFLGASFDLLLGEAATQNTVTALYGLVYRYPAPERTSSGGQGDGRPLDQQLTASGNLSIGKTTFRLGVSFADLSGPDRDFGGYAEKELFTVTPSVSYALSSKTKLSSSINLPYRQLNGRTRVSGVSNSNFVDYSFDAKLQTGVGLTFGQEQVERGETQSFQRLLPRFNFQLTPRIALSGTCGVEWRSAAGHGKSSVEPVFDFHATWTPRIGTSFSFGSGRQAESSASLTGNDYVSTTINLSVAQRLGPRITLQLSAAYEAADYSPAEDGSPAREDELFSTQVSLQFDLGRHWSASLAYDREDNHSTTHSYTSSQAQLQLSLLF